MEMNFSPGDEVEVYTLWAYPDMWSWSKGYRFVSMVPDSQKFTDEPQVFLEIQDGYTNGCVIRERLDRIRKLNK